VVVRGAVIRSGSLVGANALVPGGMEVPTAAMALGVPARLREDTVEPGQFDPAVASYIERGRRFREEQRRID
jgi:carbonic anhydrase/acetyltransferase-like protein (isoleucine patch superfamily)